MGIIDKINADAKKSGQNKSKFIYIKDGQKIRVRFLSDMDDGMEVTFHDSYKDGINVPCQELFGRDCSYCDLDGLRTRSQYIWSVWDYEANEVKLFMFPVNNCSPIPGLVANYELHQTLTDRDYMIGVTGKNAEKTYSIVSMDKVKFRNVKAKPFSQKTILSMLDKAYPSDDSEDDDEEEEVKCKSNSESKLEDDWEEDEVDYSEMSPQKLYKLCKERKIDVVARKSAKYYIKQLKEFDQAQDDWEDLEEEDDDWED